MSYWWPWENYLHKLSMHGGYFNAQVSLCKEQTCENAMGYIRVKTSTNVANYYVLVSLLCTFYSNSDLMILLYLIREQFQTKKQFPLLMFVLISL